MRLLLSFDEQLTSNESALPLCNELAAHVDEHPDVEQVKWIAYGIVIPALVFLGIMGDMLNLVVLTRPNMNGTAYVYMRAYALASLMALFCAIPFVHRKLLHRTNRWHNYYKAIFYAKVVNYVGNSCIGVSVVMLLALTVERYISVCLAARSRNMCGVDQRSYAAAFVLPLITFLVHCPYLFLAHVVQCFEDPDTPVYMEEANEEMKHSIWFMIYNWIMEISFKLTPAVVLFYLNIHIIYTYRAVCQRRKAMVNGKITGEQKRQLAEESRLMFLLGGTSTIFFICMTPMIALSVTVHSAGKFHHNYYYEIFRAIANVLEVMNFSVTFYIYCLFSKDFRETFLKCVRSARRSSVPHTYTKSVSAGRDTLRPP